jgi:hypothetical protein
MTICHIYVACQLLAADYILKWKECSVITLKTLISMQICVTTNALSLEHIAI